MATKNNPGKYDCYQNADPDEPMFVLLGRDPVAPVLVRLWVVLREDGLGDKGTEQLAEAKQCAKAMEAWCEKLGKQEKLKRVQALMLEIFGSGPAEGEVTVPE